jgi:hypothetical protein
MSDRPRYYFCWWCSSQLWGKRSHVTMRSTVHPGEDASGVIVHHSCAAEMEREGGWEPVTV